MNISVFLIATSLALLFPFLFIWITWEHPRLILYTSLPIHGISTKLYSLRCYLSKWTRCKTWKKYLMRPMHQITISSFFYCDSNRLDKFWFSYDHDNCDGDKSDQNDDHPNHPNHPNHFVSLLFPEVLSSSCKIHLLGNSNFPFVIQGMQSTSCCITQMRELHINENLKMIVSVGNKTIVEGGSEVRCITDLYDTHGLVWQSVCVFFLLHEHPVQLPIQTPTKLFQMSKKLNLRLEGKFVVNQHNLEHFIQAGYYFLPSLSFLEIAKQMLFPPKQHICPPFLLAEKLVSMIRQKNMLPSYPLQFRMMFEKPCNLEDNVSYSIFQDQEGILCYTISNDQKDIHQTGQLRTVGWKSAKNN